VKLVLKAVKKWAVALSVIAGSAVASSAYADNAESVALAINLTGQLCAEIVSVKPLEVGGGSSVFEVVCIEYRGGSATVTYLIDTRTEPPTVMRQ